MMKTMVYSTHSFEKPFLNKAFHNSSDIIFTAYRLDMDTVKLATECKAIIAFTTDDLSAEVLDKLYYNGIRFIALRSMGYDHINLVRAKELGIKVANVPNYSPFSVAEHALTLLLALNRKIINGQKLMARNNFSLNELVGFDLHEKTIGIIGLGKIGIAFAKIMNGFGCQLLGYDPIENMQLTKQIPLSYTSLKELCQQSDIISIHCPLNDETRYLFNEKVFNLMKKGSFLINTARGSIINTIDMLAALDNGTLAGAGLDVYENEKNIFFRNHLNTIILDPTFEKLRNHKNVIITGHQGFLTKEALSSIAQTTAENIENWEKEKINPNEL